MRRPHVAVTLLLSCATALATSRAADAAEAETPPATATETETAPPPRVVLVLVGEAAGGSVLLERSASWFRDAQIAVEVGHAAALAADAVFAPADAPGVKIWIWLRTPGAARVFIAAREPSAGAQRYWVSDVPLQHGLDELGAEELAQVVHLSALAVWAGNLESKRSEVEARLGPPTAPQPTSPQPRPNGAQRRFTLGAEYSLRFTGDEGPAQAVGALFGLGYRRQNSEALLRLHAAALLPRDTQHSELRLSLNGGAVALDVAAAVRASHRLWLTAALGSGTDIVRYRATDSSALLAAPASTDLRPFIAAELGVRAELGAVSFELLALVSAQLLRLHYDVTADGQPEHVLTPWQLQPGFGVRLSF